MAKKSSSVLSSNPFNEMGPGIEGEPTWPPDELYSTYDQCSAMQSSQAGADMVSTPNSRSGEGIMGGVASGEPNPYGVSTTNQSKGRK